MSLVEESFSRLFPDAEFGYEAAVLYSGKFKPYNATVRKIGNRLNFSLSRSWKSTSDEIVIGLVQNLLVRILKKKGISTLNMQLYDDFIKGISEVAAVNNGSGSSDESLESSFARVNEKYFLGIADKPNLRWGLGSFRKLASYDYHTNTITVSSLFRDAPQQLLDYLMYHEMLHKKLKFSSSNGRISHHGAEFRKLEAAFDQGRNMEGELNAFISQSTRSSRPKQRLTWRRMLLFV